MYTSTKNRIMGTIYAKGHNRAFSANDFVAKFKRYEIDQSLSILTKKGKLRRITNGIYDYPRYSEIIKDFVPADIDDIAHAIARKFNWRINPDGNTALNYLGLSNQIVGRNIYLSDGPNRKYNINGRKLEFKHIPAKEAKLKYTESFLIVQALKSLKKENITDELLKKISQKYSLQQWEKIRKDTVNTAEWIRENINRIIKVKEYDHNREVVSSRTQ
ncbi:MAG: DUF6088 family protein [Endomicrobiaceae bacterium]|nr:DUF6088 family protein [Endomicrobiaceae bacterium]